MGRAELPGSACSAWPLHSVVGRHHPVRRGLEDYDSDVQRNRISQPVAGQQRHLQRDAGADLEARGDRGLPEVQPGRQRPHSSSPLTSLTDEDRRQAERLLEALREQLRRAANLMPPGLPTVRRLLRGCSDRNRQRLSSPVRYWRVRAPIPGLVPVGEIAVRGPDQVDDRPLTTKPNFSQISAPPNRRFSRGSTSSTIFGRSTGSPGPRGSSPVGPARNEPHRLLAQRGRVVRRRSPWPIRSNGRRTRRCRGSPRRTR